MIVFVLQLEKHLSVKSGTCPLAEIHCPYSTYGCSFVVSNIWGGGGRERRGGGRKEGWGGGRDRKRKELFSTKLANRM